MQGLVLAGPGTIQLAGVADPVIDEPDQVIVDVTLAGLCGSDLHLYRGTEPARPGVVQGHEAVGVVSHVGDDVRSFRPGDRVLVPFTTSCGHCGPCARGLSSRCVRSRLFGWGDPASDSPALQGCQAERLLVPDADGTLVAVPEDIDDHTALLLTDNLPTAWYAVERADWTDGTLVVLGLGAVGRCAVAIASSNGAGPVVAADPLAARRDAVDEHGVTVVHPEELDRVVGAGGATAVVDAAGPVTAQTHAARLTRPGGTVSIIAVQTAAQFGIDPVTAYDRNLTIRAGRAPVRSIVDRIIDRVTKGEITVPEVVTHRDRPLEEGPALYEAFAVGDVGKATFRIPVSNGSH